MHTHIRTHANLYDDCSNPIMIVSNPPGITIKFPARRPGGFEIRRKKRFDLLKRGICNPPTTMKGKAISLAADYKSAEHK